MASPLSEEWVLNTLAPLCARVLATKGIDRMRVHVNDKLACFVLITYESNNYIKISRAEFCNLDTQFLPNEYILALPYPLYALIHKLQPQLHEIVGCPVKVERLWGWGNLCDIHYQLEQRGFLPTTKFDSLYFSHRNWSTDPVENAEKKMYLWKEVLPFMYAIQDVCDNFEKHIVFKW